MLFALFCFGVFFLYSSQRKTLLFSCWEYVHRVTCSLEASFFGWLGDSLSCLAYWLGRRPRVTSVRECRWLASRDLPLPMKLVWPNRFLRLWLPLQGRGPGSRGARRCRCAGVFRRLSIPSSARLCGHVWFSPVFPEKLRRVGFSCLVFLINQTRWCRVCIGFWPVFLINWSFSLFLINRQSSCRLLQKKNLIATMRALGEANRARWTRSFWRHNCTVFVYLVVYMVGAVCVRFV